MGMFDTIYAELDCPFCGRKYRHTPLTQEQAENEVREYKQRQIESRRRHLQNENEFLYMQDHWAKQDGFDDIDAWIEQLDTSDKIEERRTHRQLGLAEIQTKEFDNVLEDFYVGDEVPKYSGHYFIPEDFKCYGCSSADENVYVKVWLEIEERKLKGILTRGPETGEPARESFRRAPLEPRPPDPHPPLHFRYHNIQAHANYNEERGEYDLKVTHLPEQFAVSGNSEEILRTMFEYFVDDYLYLLGKDPHTEKPLHEQLLTIYRRLPSDYLPYGERERDEADCSCDCKHFLKLPGKLGMDWGVCANPDSPRAGLLTFEHQGCEQFEG